MEGAPKEEKMIDVAELMTEDVAGLIREKGIENPEVLDIVTRWTIYQEELVKRINTSKATIMFNIARADLYVAAGDKEGAIECLEEARGQAHQENEEILYNTIMQKMDALEK